MPAPTPSPPPHPLPFPFSSSAAAPLDLVAQGAEGLVYCTTLPDAGTRVALKVRPRKLYRHPALDARLARSRALAEARVLVRCRRRGVDVPAVVAADWDAGWLALEWIDGRTVRRCLNERLAGAPVADDDLAGEGDAIGKGADETAGGDAALRSLMRRVGAAVGALHAAGVVHGDLTTSNLMLRRPSPPPPPQPPAAGEPTPNPSLAAATAEGGDDNDDGLGGSVVLVDFGLAAQSAQDEDRAVDLYVLERAFASTHPAAAGELFRGEVLRAYAAAFPGGKAVLRRLDEVRMRGRKRSMLG